MVNTDNTGASTVAELAGKMLAKLELRTRADQSTYWALEDGSPDWMKNVCFRAHGDMLPDEWRYRFIVEALWSLSSDDEEGDDLAPDVYTDDLTSWLHSRTDRYTYCDQAVEEGYGFANTVTLLGNGQQMEKQEVFSLIKAALEDLATEA